MEDLRVFTEDFHDFKWYDKYLKEMGYDALSLYMTKVYNYGCGIPPGKYITVRARVKPENLELYVKSLCYLACYPPDGMAFEFSEDFEKFKRL